MNFSFVDSAGNIRDANKAVYITAELGSGSEDESYRYVIEFADSISGYSSNTYYPTAVAAIAAAQALFMVTLT